MEPTLPLSDPPSNVGAETKSPTVGDERTPNKEVAMSDTTEAAAAPAEADKKVRAPRTDLEPDVKAVTDSFITGALVVEDGKPLTPHRIAAEVGKARAGNPPSVGAVSAVLVRWAKYGFAEVSDKPKAFVAYTAAGTEKGLSAMKEAHRAELKAAKAEAKAETAAEAAVS